MKLHIDIETYSSVNLKTSGVYKYVESVDFEILLIAWAIDDGPIKIIDLAQGDTLALDFLTYYENERIEKWAHNAVFERLAFKAIGYEMPINQWFCSAIKGAYCGYPLALDQVSAAMRLGGDGKLSTGKALIRYFCVPVKPTKVNGGRRRNLPRHKPEKWDAFIEYCKGDVEAERQVCKRTAAHELPETERKAYILDQEINDRGVAVDLDLAKAATKIAQEHAAILFDLMRELTSLDNPNSIPQLKGWLSEQLGRPITALDKDALSELIEETKGTLAEEVLKLRVLSAKTSIKKYEAMLNCVCDDGRAHGLVQFYGAHTGRWAGRLIQIHNLPRNYIELLELTRALIKTGDLETAELILDSISVALSQLVRTAFVAKPNRVLAVVDYSAIEARVIAWLAGETWRLDVFNTHGKIYEASASSMFNIPIDSITKDSPERSKGKIAELALGYQGSVGALKQMGGEEMGLSDKEMATIVSRWRAANPAIVRLWAAVDSAAKRAVKNKTTIKFKNLYFKCDGNELIIRLPSGRKMFYQAPGFKQGKFRPCLYYWGSDSKTKRWTQIETYGGKLTENIVQAIARDVLSESMVVLDTHFDIAMHVHDEVVIELMDNARKAENLEFICTLMSDGFKWSEGLPLAAEGFITKFYKK